MTMGTTPDFPLIGPPRISTLGFTEVLRSNRSPAAPEALYAYRAALDQGVDPAVLLAVFRKESTFGRFGKANRNRSWGNIRDPQTGAFRAYSSWTDGARDAARLLAVYGRNQIRPGRNTSTVQTMPYVWAPAADGNGPDRYGDQLARWISEWQRRYPASGSGAGLRPPTGAPAGAEASSETAFMDLLRELGISTDPTHVITAAEAARIAAAGYPSRTDSVRESIAKFYTNKTVAEAMKGDEGFDPGAIVDDVAAAIAGLPGAIGGVAAQVVVNGALLIVVVGLGWAGLRDLLSGGAE